LTKYLKKTLTLEMWTVFSIRSPFYDTSFFIPKLPTI
jgi:hypothetical protein